MQKLFKIFVKRFLNLFLILIFSQSAVALEVYFKSASKSLDVEIANSDAKRRQGLMHRKDLAKDHGMLFLWPQSNTRCMWMKNTSLPLSVAYLSNDGVIQEIYNMVPFSEDSVCSVNSTRIALEVNAGWFKENGIAAGDKLDF
ncbi:DUF192 domain-containing protein [Gammaproteobacteria bacterium]|nr:DUF192 domain-containing protein [Gammaproteobacteria bacterium]MDB9901028.1 DUF192 domain-containing protein [Gammaproteobacteria bacterium]